MNTVTDLSLDQYNDSLIEQTNHEYGNMLTIIHVLENMKSFKSTISERCMKARLKFMALLIIFVLLNSSGSAHTTYTGYSGAPGSKGYCAQCHGSGTGTIVVSGIPLQYQSSQSYTITVAHNGGSPIVNFNASTRIGTTTAVAGTFVGSTNTTPYTANGYETGIHASVTNIDTARYIWTAPAIGSGTVTFYISGLQGSMTGPSTKITVSSTELTSGVIGETNNPKQFLLAPNYPNPFNPTTTISYQLPTIANVKLTIINTLGQEVAIVNNGVQGIGAHSVNWDASGMPSGIYFYNIIAVDNSDPTNQYSQTRKMVLLK
jgi:hypothetical protein